MITHPTPTVRSSTSPIMYSWWFIWGIWMMNIFHRRSITKKTIKRVTLRHNIRTRVFLQWNVCGNNYVKENHIVIRSFRIRHMGIKPFILGTRICYIEIKLEKSPFIDKFIKNMSIDHITISKRRPFAKYSFGLTKIINILYKGLNFQTLKGIESV